jgi:hypothetical protein
MTRLANRTQELELFRQMLRGEVRERILLVEAPSGYGKTGLMARFVMLCPQVCPQQIHTVPVDLKAAQEGIAYVFSRIERQLGKKHFSNFNAAIEQFLNSGVEISNNRLTGEGSQIQVILNVPPEERKYRLTRLQKIFFEDLERFNRPIAFILDTYNDATEELARWIESQFLAEVAMNPKFFAVVAGQHVPQSNIEWQSLHCCCKLDPIMEREAWYGYVREVGFNFSPQEINTLVDAVAGVPAEVVKLLEGLAQARRRA